MKNNNPSLKILHVGNHTHPCVGGVEGVIWQSACEEAARGHDVEIMVFETCNKGNILPPLETINGVKITRVPQKGFSFFRIPPTDILLEHAREKDIVHIHGFGGWLHILSAHRKKLRGKVVLTTHGGIFHTPKRALLKWIYLNAILPSKWRSLDGVIYVSESDKKAFAHYPRVPSEVIPNGIETTILDFPRVPKKNNQFIFVGRLSQNKRVDLVIETFARVAKEVEDARLLIVGEDWEGLQNSLMEKARELGIISRVSFKGRVSDEERIHLLAESPFFVSASTYEGFGISAIEAMALGCIPCLQPIPSFLDFVKNGAGVCVDYTSPDSAALEWKKLIRLPRAEMQILENKSCDFGRSFGWKSIIQRHLAFYHSLIEQK